MARLTTAITAARQRFIDAFNQYPDATVLEAENRGHDTVLGLKGFID